MERKEAVKWLQNLRSTLGSMKYEELWEFGQALEETEKLIANPWKNPKEEPPEEGVDVLMMYPSGDCMVMYRHGDWWEDGESYRCDIIETQLWMPIPKPLEEKK